MLKLGEKDGGSVKGGMKPGSGQWTEVGEETGSGKSERRNVWVALTCQKFHHDFPHLPLLYLLYARSEPSRCRK